MIALPIFSRCRQRGSLSPGDPLWAYVKSLMHYDDGNGSTAFVDQAGAAWAATGAGAIETTDQSKFGTGSYSNLGSGYLVSGGISLGSSRFCIEGWAYPVASSTRGVFATEITSSASGLQLGYDGSGNIQLLHNGSVLSPGGGLPTLNTWYSWCVERDGSGLIRVYINGSVFASVTDTADFSGMSSFYFGVYFSGSFPGNQYLDETRITVGQPADRYGGAYTPATAPFPNHA